MPPTLHTTCPEPVASPVLATAERSDVTVGARKGSRTAATEQEAKATSAPASYNISPGGSPPPRWRISPVSHQRSSPYANAMTVQVLIGHMRT